MNCQSVSEKCFIRHAPGTGTCRQKGKGRENMSDDKKIKWSALAFMAFSTVWGFGNVVNSQKIVAVVSPDAAPVKRMVQSVRGTRSLIDATQGRKTKAVIVTSDDYLVLSALQPETIARRFAEIYDYEDKGEVHE